VTHTTSPTGSGIWQPLAGVRSADHSVLFAGPVTTTVLADLGADVVKIEPPGGDLARMRLPRLGEHNGNLPRRAAIGRFGSLDADHAAQEITS
jgi:crotonobetainyl-CoA:carnitine CoA-transferase CaiB-like acyl-CoA transferase